MDSTNQIQSEMTLWHSKLNLKYVALKVVCCTKYNTKLRWQSCLHFPLADWSILITPMSQTLALKSQQTATLGELLWFRPNSSRDDDICWLFCLSNALVQSQICREIWYSCAETAKCLWRSPTWTPAVMGPHQLSVHYLIWSARQIQDPGKSTLQ